MTPTTRMLRQRTSLVRPGEQADADGVPRPSPTTLAADVPCALRPVAAAQAAQLHTESGAENIDALLYLHPDAPEARGGDQAVIDGAGTWVAVTAATAHHGTGGQLDYYSLPVVREVR